MPSGPPGKASSLSVTVRAAESTATHSGSGSVWWDRVAPATSAASEAIPANQCVNGSPADVPAVAFSPIER